MQRARAFRFFFLHRLSAAARLPVGPGVAGAVTADTTTGLVEVGAGAIAKVRLVAGPLFPAMSVARTKKVCGPSLSDPEVKGELHDASEAPSSPHSKNAGSPATNVKLTTLVDTVPLGPEVIETPGGAVSSS